MFRAYASSSTPWESIILYNFMRQNDVFPDNYTFPFILKACSRLQFLNKGEEIHGSSLKLGFEFDVFVQNSLISMYSACGGIETARRVFDLLPLLGYLYRDFCREALELFGEMNGGSSERPNALTTVSVITTCARIGDLDLGKRVHGFVMVNGDNCLCCFACGHFGALDQGKWVHAHCERNGIEMNLTVKNSLIDMYAKCGDINKALEIFLKLIQPDVFLWSVMISGLAMNGKSGEALDLFSEMSLSSEVKPNDVTFLGVLSACSYGGLVEKAVYYFNLMTKTYNLTPRIEHYGCCMVDLLGRANLLVEAENFIRAMPIEPDAVIWRSLLFHFAAKRILELEPRKCEDHILLSNTYAAISSWSDVKRVREGMDVHGIQKQPGCSFVEINGLVHEFFVADYTHPQTDIIYETIIAIHKLLQSEGYDPDTSDFFNNELV
ncbi:hypothetical protein NE237_031268 [Protea cynaroides]|uniref:Pentatricopeptide repeat-containing protein n=1 Tax=Protea cynaroides TaxID=273540 RepID=A0A9Q0L1R9_9MAGN|nr:hypothetical protein NE237_031268 [Protea cynaroides]